MRKTKSKWRKISAERWIGLLAAVMAVAGWALLIVVNLNLLGGNEPPVIQEVRLSRPVVSVGEMVPVRVIVKDPNLPDDEIKYFWVAQLGRIGEQLHRFQDPAVIYVAPDLPGIDVISVTVYDREKEKDKDFCIVTIKEAERLGSQYVK